MNENFPRPGWWTREGQKRFGDWSQTKAGLICDVMNIDREVWLGVLGEGTFTQGYLSYVGKYMYRWLRKIRRRMRMENGWKWDRIPKINLIVL